VGYRMPPLIDHSSAPRPDAPRLHTLPRLDPILGDPTFVNDTIRREHSPPAASRHMLHCVCK
jgi:hypothetical protein